MLPCTPVQEAVNYATSWAGDSFDGLGVTAAIRRCDKTKIDDVGRANYVSYIYGDCEAGGEEGCSPPIEIQSWPAIEVTQEMFTYAGPGGEARPSVDTTVGGMPARKFDDGKQVVIFRPETTVMVFGEDAARVERFANGLVLGPKVLTDLAGSGLVFDPSCVTDQYYCVAARNFTGDFDVTVNLTPAANHPPFINTGGAEYPTGTYSGSGTGTVTFVRPDGTIVVDSPMDFSLKGDYSTAKIEAMSLTGIFSGTQQVGGASFTARSAIDIDDIGRQVGKAKSWVAGQPSWIPTDYDVTYGVAGGEYGIASIRLRGELFPAGRP